MIFNSARTWIAAVVACCAMTAPLSADSDDAKSQDGIWSSDYAATMAAARREAVPMVVYFHSEGDAECRRFEEKVANSEAVRRHLAACRCVRIPLDEEIISGGKPVKLVEHPAFSNLNGRPGLAVIDFATQDPSGHGRVSRSLAFDVDQPIVAEDLAFLPSVSAKGPDSTDELIWLTNYEEATADAESNRRMLLIYFQCRKGESGCADFEEKTLRDPAILERMATYTCLKLARDETVNIDGRETVLLKYRDFSEMVGLPGIAIVDYSNPEAPYFGQVVSTFPFLHGEPYDPQKMAVILDLPPGKLTQRTLIYAVRTHPDGPQSTNGKLDQYLASEAESHSLYQAKVRLQGHQAWESRFHRINRRLPAGTLAAEVCAESWPGESLLEAAIDCVQCWRQSSGHWRSVRTAHPVFGYDMHRGSNGIWYATGIFGKRGR